MKIRKIHIAYQNVHKRNIYLIKIYIIYYVEITTGTIALLFDYIELITGTRARLFEYMGSLF